MKTRRPARLLPWILAATMAGVAPFAWIHAQSDNQREFEQQEKELYDSGTRALDDREWDRAVRSFERAARLAGHRTDGALYWKAYALAKLGRGPEALETIATLRNTFPDSRWLDDAEVLQMEIRGTGGDELTAEEQENEELKLMALNSLLNMEPERAIPMLERLINGSHSTKLKRRALFVLIQTGSPRAREIVYDIARGHSNPELQREAVQHLAMFGTPEAKQVLREIYDSTSDLGLRRTILHSYMASGDTGFLLEVARTGKEPELRRAAIQALGAAGETDELMDLYRTETSTENKTHLLHAMAIGSRSGEFLMEIAREDSDPELRRAAIQGLGMMGGRSEGIDLIELYRNERDTEVKKTILQMLMIRNDAGPLIEIARKETDPDLRKAAVMQLSHMQSPEAVKFMLEILEE